MKTKYKILIAIVPAIFLLDQATKLLIIKTMELGARVPVIPGFFDIVNYRNTGAAFGLFSGMVDHVRIPFFYIIALVAVVLMSLLYRSLEEDERLMPIALSLVLGGIAGNMMDRIRLGSVVDFLSFHVGDDVLDFTLAGRHISLPLEWPAFNVADSAITVAMILIFIAALRRSRGAA